MIENKIIRTYSVNSKKVNQIIIKIELSFALQWSFGLMC